MACAASLKSLVSRGRRTAVPVAVGVMAVGVILSPASGIPPLSDGQQARLATAFDGRDHQEEAFAALLENAAAYPADVDPGPALLGAAAVRLAPDHDAMLAAPDDHRGTLCRIVGVLQQQTRLDRPFAGVSEWFVRDDAGQPIIVFVAGLAADDEARFADGQRIAIYARFYKRVDAEARDGRSRRYPAYVGAAPWRVAGVEQEGEPATSLLLMGGLLVGGFLVVIIMVALLGRRAAGTPRRRGGGGAVVAADLDEGPRLPDDPAAALDELKRRAARGAEPH